MEFVENVLGGNEGIEWYYVVGLLLFISLFIIILYRTFRMPKGEVIEIKESILDNDDNIIDNKN
ncbi:MAG: hypothetical protein E4G95_00335 [Bacteroidia bacterium]|nr:MAG: hypothetical protein E4G95_00335 [Bacteroidia bacterium]